MSLKIRAVAAALVMFTSAGAAVAAGVPGQGTWESTLHARDLTGDGVADAYYDDSLGITWLDVSLGPSVFGNTLAGVALADSAGYYGQTGWHLPAMSGTNARGCTADTYGYQGTLCGYNVNVAGNELAHLWYSTLGNKARYDETGSERQAGWGTTNTGPFKVLQSSTWYWAGAEYTPTIYANPADQRTGWYFSTIDGSQSVVLDYQRAMFALVVHEGDVGVSLVPEPGTYSLMLAGLGGLGGLLGLRRRRQG